MTARLYLPAEVLAGSTVIVSGEPFQHLCRVLRLDVGDAVIVFDGTGVERIGTILGRGPDSAELALGPARVASTSAFPLTLVVGVPKGDKMELIVQKATELGVTSIVPAVTERSIPRRDATRAARRLERWRKIAREAARQSGRSDLLLLAAEAPLGEALAALPPGGTRLVFWEAAGTPPLRARLPERPAGNVIALVGPEGGLSEGDVALARAHGFEPVGLGSRILRVETAALAVAAILGYAWGELG